MKRKVRVFRICTIRARLLTAFILMVLLPVLAISAFSGVMGWRSGQQQVFNQLESVATLKEAEIETWVNRLQTNLVIALHRQEVAWMEVLLQESPAAADYQDACGNVREHFEQVIEQTQLFEELFLMDLQGRVVLSTDAAQEGKIHRNQTYFRAGLEEAYVHPPFYSPSLGRMSVVAVCPLVDEQGHTLGVLAGRASMATLNEIMLERAGLGETGETYLVGSNHVLLSGSRFAVQDEGIGLYVRTEGANAALGTHTNDFGLYDNYRGVPVVGVYHWLPELQVALLAEQHQSEAFRSTYATMAVDVGVVIVATLVAAVAALFVARSIAVPLADLAETAAQVAAGDLELTARVEREDEIGTLAQAFNSMTAQLRGLISSLEQRVAELKRTEEALRRSEERHRSLFDGIPVGLYRTTPEGQVLDANPALVQMLSYPDRESLLATNAADFYVDSEERKQWQALMEHEGIVREFEMQARRYDGTAIWAQDTARTVRDADGRVLHYEGNLEDITARKYAEEQLRTRERFLECLSEVSQHLLRASDLSEALPTVLRYLGETATVSRVYLFENHPGAEGELLCSQRYEWCAPGAGPQIDNPDLQNFTYVASGFARWVEVLEQGDVISGAVTDFPEDERGVLEPQDIRSILIIPIFVSDDWYGFIGFDVCDQVREWQQVEVDLLRATASDIASAIEREQAARQTQALAEAAAALTATLDFEQVLDRILEQAGRVVPSAATNIMLIEDDRARIVRWRGYERFGVKEPATVGVFRIAETPTLRGMIENTAPIVIPDTATHPDWVRASGVWDWLRSYAAAPIVVRDEVVGFLNVDSAIPGFFTPAHAGLLRAFAGHAAAAIENARLYERERQRVAQRARMLELSRELRLSLDLPETLDRICQTIVEDLGWQQVILSLRDYETKTSRPVAMEGYDEETVARTLALPPTPFEELDILRKEFRISHSYYIDHQHRDAITNYPDELVVTVSAPDLEPGGWHPDDILLVPIEGREGSLGFISPDNPVNRQRPTLETVQELEVFANQVATAIENARLFEATNQRVAELEAMRQVSLSLTSRLELEAVLEAILESVLKLLTGVQVTHIFLYQAERLTFGVALWPDGRRGEPLAEPRSDGLTYTVAKQGEPIVVPDMRAHPLYADAPCEWEGSIVGLPLKIGQRVVGVMNVSYQQPRAFPEAELRVLRLLADQAAIAIENARLFQAEQAQARRLALLADVARIVAITLDTDELLQAVAASIHYHYGYPAVMLFTPDEAEATMVLRGYGGIPARPPETASPGVYRQPIRLGIIGHVARTGEPYLAPDISTDPYHYSPDPVAVRSEVCVPIRDRDRVVGVIDLESEQLADFDERDQSLLEAAADTVAIGLRNARLYEETQRRVHELTLLNRISAAFGAALDTDTLINRALAGLQELVGADRTYFVSADLDARTWQTTHELVAPGIESDIGLSGTFDDVPVELETILAAQPFAVSDIATDPRVEATREMYRSLAMQSMLLVPVQARGRLYGALGFDYCREKHVWHPGEIRLLEAVAHQLELALENVRLFEEARLRAEELATALTRLEELDRLKDEFIQNVSHELRSPLALIRGYAEMLDMGELGTLQLVQQKPVAIIARRARMLSDLVRDITLILEAEVSPPEPEPVPLGELAWAAVEDFQIAIAQAELTLEAEIAPDLPPVNGSPTYLRRVLDNLLGNAVKFTPEGGAITVRAQQEGEQVALEVSDTGIGIPPDQLARIFERFYQVDGTIRRRHGGVGLGLALVRELVEAYGGKVDVESEVGRGTTFTVTLPIFED